MNALMALLAALGFLALSAVAVYDMITGDIAGATLAVAIATMLLVAYAMARE